MTAQSVIDLFDDAFDARHQLYRSAAKRAPGTYLEMKGKHYTYTHPKIFNCRGNFDCGHGRNPDVLPVYVKSIANTLKNLKGIWSNGSEGNEMTACNPSEYRITIVNKAVDGQRYFVGTVGEFPHVTVY